MNHCGIPGCDREARKTLCPYHLKSVRMGRTPNKDEWGVRLNPPCVVPECTSLSETVRPGECHVHSVQKRSGRDFNQFRKKRKNYSPGEECSVEGCDVKARSRGMCQKHYARHVMSPPKTAPCPVEGCSRRTSKDRCYRHQVQFDKYGIAWEGPRPNADIARIRVAGRSECRVEGCHKRSSSEDSVFCTFHRRDWFDKGVSEERYLNLMSITRCEACGSDSRVVTDHRHGHHDKDSKMCEECIRGRLCSGCNTALGLLGDSSDRVRKLLDYAERVGDMTRGEISRSGE